MALTSEAAQAYGFTDSNQSAVNLRFANSSMRLRDTGLLKSCKDFKSIVNLKQRMTIMVTLWVTIKGFAVKIEDFKAWSPFG